MVGGGMSERVPIDGEPETHPELIGATAVDLVRQGLDPDTIGERLVDLMLALQERARSLRTRAEG
jgi:hypothetical protein